MTHSHTDSKANNDMANVHNTSDFILTFYHSKSLAKWHHVVGAWIDTTTTPAKDENGRDAFLQI